MSLRSYDTDESNEPCNKGMQNLQFKKPLLLESIRCKTRACDSLCTYESLTFLKRPIHSLLHPFFFSPGPNAKRRTPSELKKNTDDIQLQGTDHLPSKES